MQVLLYSRLDREALASASPQLEHLLRQLAQGRPQLAVHWQRDGGYRCARYLCMPWSFTVNGSFCRVAWGEPTTQSESEDEEG